MAPLARLHDELSAISDYEHGQASSKISQRLCSKSPAKGLALTTSKQASCDQSTLQDPSQLQIGKEDIGKPIEKSRSGSIFKSYREVEVDRSHCSVAVGPGPGSYNLADPWNKKKDNASAHADSLQALVSRDYSNPSIPHTNRNESGYYLCSFETKMKQEQSLLKAKPSEAKVREKVQGTDFSSSNSKRIAFPINGLTSMVGYPVPEQRLDYKCKNSCVFPGSNKRKFESQSERVLKRLFCRIDLANDEPVTDQRQEIDGSMPGPGAYHPLPQSKLAVSARGVVVPFMTTAQRPQLINKKETHMGPSYYSPESISTHAHHNPTIGFTSQVQRSIFPVNDVPPVGTYTVQSSENESGLGALSITKTEGRRWHENTQVSPGPAMYLNAPDSLEYKNKYTYQAQSVFRSKAVRELFSKSVLEEKPGPGDYETDKVNGPELPLDLQPKKTPFLSASPRFEPTGRAPIFIDENVPPVKLIHQHKNLKKKCKSPPTNAFNQCAQRFDKPKQQTTPPVGTYYNQQNDFRGWDTKTFSKLFSRDYL